jgi:hypothetical protein
MAAIWPTDVYNEFLHTPEDDLRPFHCVLLMPFSSKRFEDVARQLELVVRNYTQSLLQTVEIGPTVVERLDWVTSAGTIQQQLWERIARADLIFCDLTGQNDNVMFEAGVCAAWKRVEQVIFIRDAFYRPEQPFDLAPFRFATYEMTSDGIPQFHQKLQSLIADVVVRFPDTRARTETREIDTPLTIDFGDNREDDRLLTPALSHRLVKDGHFEFGSLWSFQHSWASIGKRSFADFQLEFVGRFAKFHPTKTGGYIGVGFRSHHPLMPFCHVLYLNRDGSIVLAHPDDTVTEAFVNVTLRGPTTSDSGEDHRFRIEAVKTELSVEVDDFRGSVSMPQVRSPGLIRFQAHVSWMGLRRLSLSTP